MTTSDIERLVQVRERVASGVARTVRVRARLSLAEVAAACRVAESTVHRWETGARVPRGAAVLRYARLIDRLGANTDSDKGATA